MEPKPDEWGLTPASIDLPATDAELGYTTNDDIDSGWAPVPATPVPLPVTRAAFTFHFVLAAYGLFRTIILKLGAHRRRS